MNLFKVSIIIATYNEEKNINILISSCLSQDYKNIELIIVDSTKTSDKTSDIARRMGAKTYKYGKERSVQRNYGVSKSTGKYVLVLDADMKLSPTVVSDCISEVKDGFIAMIIPEQSYGEGFWARCKALERNCYIGDPDIEAARFFDKKCFLKTGGYNTEMISGEDWDLNNKIKMRGRIGRINSYIFHNEGKLSLSSDLKKKIYYSGKSTSYIHNNIFGVKQILLFIFRPAYYRNWKMLISDPIHFTGFLIMKLSELFIGGFIIMTKPEIWRKIIK